MERPKDAHGKPDIIPTSEVTKLCRGLERNINSLGSLRNPLLCERPLNPEFNAFTKPKWTKLDPNSHIELIKKMDIALNYSRHKAPSFDAVAEEQWRAKLQKRLESIELAIAKVDLNGDGNAETVIKYSRSPCNDESAKHPGIAHTGVVYLVTDDNFSEVMLLNSYTANGEIFIHQGSAYFTQAEYMLPSEEYLLVVQQPVAYNGDPNSLCDLRFLPHKCPTNQRPRFGYATVCKLIFKR